MELSELMKGRRSIFRFKDTEVPVELVKELLDTARWAPNHGLTQPWRFLIVHGEGRERIARLNPPKKGKSEKDPALQQEAADKFFQKMMAVPMFVIVVLQENPNISIRDEDYAAASCVIQNFCLLAWEKGIGSKWSTYAFIHDAAYREALGIKPGERVIASLHVGYPEVIPSPQPRAPVEEQMTVISARQSLFD